MCSHGIQPNVVAYSALACAHAHCGEWQEVEALACQMKSEGQVMNDYFLYTQLLAYASCRPRQAQRAERTFRDAVALGVQVNRHVFVALQRALGRARAQELVRELGVGDLSQFKVKRGNG